MTRVLEGTMNKDKWVIQMARASNPSIKCT